MFESFFNFIFDRVQPEKGDRLIVKDRYKRAERNAERGRRNKTMRQSYDLQNGRKKTAAMGKRYCEGEIGYAERKKAEKTDMQIPKREGTTFERFCGDAAYKKAASFAAVAGARGRAADGLPASVAPRKSFSDEFTDSAVAGARGRAADGLPASAAPRKSFSDKFTDSAVAGARGRAADGFERYFAGARGFNVKERMRYENLCLADVFRLG